MKTNLTKAEEKTISFYNIVAPTWLDEQSTNNHIWGTMDDFYKLLPSGRTLEIGCGGGRDAKDYLFDHYEYTGTDISDGFLKLMASQFPKATLYKKSVYDLDFPKDSFDGFWASAVLIHVPKKRISLALKNIRNVIKDKGVGFISIKEGKNKVLAEDGRTFFHYTNEEFQEILKNNGMDVVKFKIVKRNERTTWLTYIVRVNKR